jgi:hypothetical protein
MAIVHDNTPLPPDGGPFVFASLGGFSCSICAPGTMTKDEVEAHATLILGEPMGGWEAVDKSKLGLGTPTPNPCNHVSGRLHWFLLGGLQAASFGLPTKK